MSRPSVQRRAGGRPRPAARRPDEQVGLDRFARLGGIGDGPAVGDGGPLLPERFSRTFGEQAAKAGLPPIRLHDLLHSWATLVVQERLGHAAIGITLDVYSHVTEDYTAMLRPSWRG